MRRSDPASVEPGLKPNHPKRHRDVVTRDRVGRPVRVVLTAPRTEQGSADQRNHAARHVHHRRARKVDVPMSEPEVHAELRQPAAAPRPVRVHGVDDRADEEAEHRERRELPALRHRPGRDRSGGVHEDHLKQEVREHRGRVGHAAQEESRVAEQAPRLAAQMQREFVAQLVEATERRHRTEAAGLQREADRPVREHADAVHHEVHGEGVGGVLGPRETGLHHGEPGLHEHHEEARNQRPHEVDGDRVRRGGGVRGLRERVDLQRRRRRRDSLRREHERPRQSEQQAKANRASHTVSKGGEVGSAWCSQIRAYIARISDHHATPNRVNTSRCTMVCADYARSDGHRSWAGDRP